MLVDYASAHATALLPAFEAGGSLLVIFNTQYERSLPRFQTAAPTKAGTVPYYQSFDPTSSSCGRPAALEQPVFRSMQAMSKLGKNPTSTQLLECGAHGRNSARRPTRWSDGAMKCKDFKFSSCQSCGLLIANKSKSSHLRPDHCRSDVTTVYAGRGKLGTRPNCKLLARKQHRASIRCSFHKKCPRNTGNSFAVHLAKRIVFGQYIVYCKIFGRCSWACPLPGHLLDLPQDCRPAYCNRKALAKPGILEQGGVGQARHIGTGRRWPNAAGRKHALRLFCWRTKANPLFRNLNCRKMGTETVVSDKQGHICPLPAFNSSIGYVQLAGCSDYLLGGPVGGWEVSGCREVSFSVTGRPICRTSRTLWLARSRALGVSRAKAESSRPQRCMAYRGGKFFKGRACP